MFQYNGSNAHLRESVASYNQTLGLLFQHSDFHNKLSLFYTVVENFFNILESYDYYPQERSWFYTIVKPNALVDFNQLIEVCRNLENDGRFNSLRNDQKKRFFNCKSALMNPTLYESIQNIGSSTNSFEKLTPSLNNPRSAVNPSECTPDRSCNPAVTCYPDGCGPDSTCSPYTKCQPGF